MIWSRSLFSITLMRRARAVAGRVSACDLRALTNSMNMMMVTMSPRKFRSISGFTIFPQCFQEQPALFVQSLAPSIPAWLLSPTSKLSINLSISSRVLKACTTTLTLSVPFATDGLRIATTSNPCVRTASATAKHAFSPGMTTAFTGETTAPRIPAQPGRCASLAGATVVKYSERTCSFARARFARRLSPPSSTAHDIRVSADGDGAVEKTSGRA
mmetsp:Transcript_11737/g.29674  ORF Transcript_11737/g.29674 Transcript_11737/m.29674 type:complete len:215 (+) Transcript_11737:1919-2563(+)